MDGRKKSVEVLEVQYQPKRTASTSIARRSGSFRPPRTASLTPASLAARGEREVARADAGDQTALQDPRPRQCCRCAQTNLLRLARVLRRFILEPYARRRRRRVAIAQLRSLDDHLLADIGLTSGQRRAQGKECPEWRDWRRGWDSNPRYGLSPYNGLANRRLQPLGHPSAKATAGYSRPGGQAVTPTAPPASSSGEGTARTLD